MEEGTVVKLKSGGPKMTISAFYWDAHEGKYDKERVICFWFKADEKQSDVFPTHTLEIID